MTARATTAPHGETHLGFIGLLVPRGRRLHPILRLDYFVRVLTYPLYFILFAVALYPDRGTRFFWVLLSFHLFESPFLSLKRFFEYKERPDLPHEDLLVRPETTRGGLVPSSEPVQ